MASEKLDYTSVIADVEAKIAAWQAVLASLRSALSLAQVVDGVDLSTVAPAASGDLGMPIDLPEGAFYGKSIPTCVELYLSAAKRKKTNKDIAAGLREGGVESNASNFENVVTGALFGLKKAGKVLRFKDGWGLSEWYPAHIRAVNPTAPAKRTKKRGSRKVKAEKLIPTMLAREGVPPLLPQKANVRALEFLRSKPESEHALADIAGHIGMGVKGARLILGKLVKTGKVKMSAPGMYAIGRPQLVAAGD
jgi:hypothetical protein